MRALTGIGWAGTYMTGLKLLADQVDAKMMSRATAGHAASIGISGAVSFACADFWPTRGWQLAFLAAGATALTAGWWWRCSSRAGMPPRAAATVCPVRFSPGVSQPLVDGLCLSNT